MRISLNKWVNFSLLFICLTYLALADTPSRHATVSKVYDGDTIQVFLDKGTKASVRLRNIDAPEIKQRGGIPSRDSLRSLVKLNSVVEITVFATDKYGRLVGDVINESKVDVNKKQVSLGWAWVYEKYCVDLPTWRPLQDKARSAKLGLWGMEESPTPPWIFRNVGITK